MNVPMPNGVAVKEGDCYLLRHEVRELGMGDCTEFPSNIVEPTKTGDENPNVVKPTITAEKRIEGTEILDSGNRTVFSTGATRDIQENKGAEHLIPFIESGKFLTIWNNLEPIDENFMKQFTKNEYIEKTMKALEDFKHAGLTYQLYLILVYTAKYIYNYDPYKLLMEVAIHYKQGAMKYEARNWEKGINVSRFIDSALRHFFKLNRGDTDEPHDRAFCWNIFCAIWTMNNKPSLNDFTFGTYDEATNTCGLNANLEVRIEAGN